MNVATNEHCVASNDVSASKTGLKIIFDENKFMSAMSFDRKHLHVLD